jgi:transcriptional regulator with XRE-family HTH domain
MRQAGYNIDALRGGGRIQLAERVGVSPSTVNRWLGAKAMPEPDKFEPLATAVGVPVVEMLVKTGIISAKAVTGDTQSDVRLRPTSPTEAADDLGITDPGDRALFLAMVERLDRSTRTAPTTGDTGGGAAAEA